MKQEIKSTKIQGKVMEALPNTMFKVELTDGRVVLVTLKGTMRKNYVRIFPGDRVVIEISQYDVDRGRIIAKER